MSWTWIRRGNLKRETESPLIVALNSVIKTNCVKTKIRKRIARLGNIVTDRQTNRQTDRQRDREKRERERVRYDTVNHINKFSDWRKRNTIVDMTG